MGKLIYRNRDPRYQCSVHSTPSFQYCDSLYRKTLRLHPQYLVPIAQVVLRDAIFNQPFLLLKNSERIRLDVKCQQMRSMAPYCSGWRRDAVTLLQRCRKLFAIILSYRQGTFDGDNSFSESMIPFEPI